jgi:hypothetical protein
MSHETDSRSYCYRVVQGFHRQSLQPLLMFARVYVGRQFGKSLRLCLVHFRLDFEDPNCAFDLVEHSHDKTSGGVSAGGQYRLASPHFLQRVVSRSVLCRKQRAQMRCFRQNARTISIGFIPFAVIGRAGIQADNCSKKVSSSRNRLRTSEGSYAYRLPGVSPLDQIEVRSTKYLPTQQPTRQWLSSDCGLTKTLQEYSWESCVDRPGDVVAELSNPAVQSVLSAVTRWGASGKESDSMDYSHPQSKAEFLSLRTVDCRPHHGSYRGLHKQMPSEARYGP